MANLSIEIVTAKDIIASAKKYGVDNVLKEVEVMTKINRFETYVLQIHFKHINGKLIHMSKNHTNVFNLYMYSIMKNHEKYTKERLLLLDDSNQDIKNALTIIKKSMQNLLKHIFFLIYI